MIMHGGLWELYHSESLYTQCTINNQYIKRNIFYSKGKEKGKEKGKGKEKQNFHKFDKKVNLRIFKA
jgi:hypothetical protein